MSNRALIALLGMLALAAASGCLGGFDPNMDGADGGANGDGGAGPDVVADFNAKVAPILGGPDGKSGACGACHSKSGGVGPAFMEPKPDMYTTLMGYPGVVGKTPETSRLYAKGVHEGPAFDSSQAPIVAAWILEYNMYKPADSDAGTAKPAIAPFAPVMGANSIDLSVLDASLVGQTITFTASTVGSSLELSQITVHTAASMGVHMVHPLWVTWDAQYNATPDPVDSFSNLDQTVFGSTNAPMGPGTLILPNWSASSKLNVVFSVIEPKMGGADGGVVAGCKALANFTANVKPLLQANCNNCHVGANPTAGLSFDFGRNTDAQVCANALTEVNLTTPAMSLLLTKPNPNVGDGHPQKIGNYGPYQTAVTNWINAEK
jgi:hypothetical protein